jgi:hypothetical protein
MPVTQVRLPSLIDSAHPERAKRVEGRGGSFDFGSSGEPPLRMSGGLIAPV